MTDPEGYDEDSVEPTPIIDDGPPTDWGGMDTVDATTGLGMHTRPMSDAESAHLAEAIANTPATDPLPAMTPHRGPAGWDDGAWSEPDPIQDPRTHDEQVSAYRIASRGPGLVRMDSVRPERVEWLWEARVPLAKVTLIDGDPSLGKSTMTLDLGARTTRGWSMPDGSPGVGPAGVVILSAEDGLADTIRPRLEAAGADLSRIVARTTVTDIQAGPGDVGRVPSLPVDIDEIERDIDAADAMLVIIDPLMAYLDAKVNAHRDHHVRRALAPLAAMAERTGAAVVLVRHLNKQSGGSAIYRGGGSIGIGGAARSVLMVATDPDAEDDDPNPRRIVAVAKVNLALPPAAMAYRLETAVIVDAAGVPITTSRVFWEGVAEGVTAADLVASPASRDDGDRTAGDEAADFLRAMLAEGPMAAAEVFARGRKEGHGERTLQRARRSIGAVSRREGFGRGSAVSWTLPAHTRRIGDIGDTPEFMSGMAGMATDADEPHDPSVAIALDLDVVERATDDDAEDIGPPAPESPVGDPVPACRECATPEVYWASPDGTYACELHPNVSDEPIEDEMAPVTVIQGDPRDPDPTEGSLVAAAMAILGADPIGAPVRPETDDPEPVGPPPPCPGCGAPMRPTPFSGHPWVCTSPGHGIRRLPVLDDLPVVDEEDVDQDAPEPDGMDQWLSGPLPVPVAEEEIAL